VSRRERWREMASAEPGVQLAYFAVGALHYAIDIMVIRQIIRPQPLRAVPHAPFFVDGVIELRGAIVPVMDLRRRFGVEPTPTQRSEKIIIVRLPGRMLGLLVDRVLGVRRVPRSRVHPTPDWFTGAEAAVFAGACMEDGGLVLILDLQGLLSAPERLDLLAFAPSPGGTPAGPVEPTR
jgi:purine-binding chemotaxis protein CheW